MNKLNLRMRKLAFMFFMLVAIGLSSCNNDDDATPLNVSTLSGTAWFGTDDDEGEVYTFTSDSDFTFSGDGPTIQGTYTFNGSNGVLTESGSFDFSVSGNVMSVDNGNSSIYIRQ